MKRAVVGGRVARIYELVERHESSGEGHARVVHQEQLGSIEARSLTVVKAAVAGTERPRARKRVTTPETNVRSCRRMVIERKGRNRFGGGRRVKRLSLIHI